MSISGGVLAWRELDLCLLLSNPSSEVIILALMFEMDHSAAPDLLTFEIHVTVLEL